jgi:nicotinate-nucleotide pyrophosphorylase (carboxylating)
MSKQRSEEQLKQTIELALAEDAGQGDVTSDILIPPGLQGKASILVKAEGVLAGTDVARMVFQKVDPSLRFERFIRDGSKVKRGDIAASVYGRVSSILAAERTALNFLNRLSGIATLTAQYVAKVQGLKVKIIDTRKTTPGLRLVEKHAVRMGGGENHRFNLADAILIKDNHLVVLRHLGLSLKDIVAKARLNAPAGLKLEVEATTLQEAVDAANAGADRVMLDNMNVEEMRRTVSMIAGRVELEASGGVNLDNVRQVAETGVNYISIGALTHSVRVLDTSLELDHESIKTG